MRPCDIMVAPLQLTMKCTCCKKKTVHFSMTNLQFQVPVIMLVITIKDINLSKDLTKLLSGLVSLNLKGKDRTGKLDWYHKF